MYDHQTGPYWLQAVVGELTGSHLSLLPSTTMAWGEWKRLYPQTQLLTGMAGSPNRFNSGRYSRVSAGEIVLTMEVGGKVTAFPLDIIGDGVVNHQVDTEPVAVFIKASGEAVGAFSRVVDGKTLTFAYKQDSQDFVDQETSIVWDAAGRATGGPMSGVQLKRLNTRRSSRLHRAYGSIGFS